MTITSATLGHYRVADDWTYNDSAVNTQVKVSYQKAGNAWDESKITSGRMIRHLTHQQLNKEHLLQLDRLDGFPGM